MQVTQPKHKPANPNFSSGPCAKRPGYDVSKLDLSVLGRSHRAKVGKDALKRACLDTARILGLPEGYRVAVVPASDTGAIEMAMWSMLGERPVDVLYWESFGQGWETDINKQLKLEMYRYCLPTMASCPICRRSILSMMLYLLGMAQPQA